MTNQETAYTEIERLVKKFKAMSGVQRKSMNEDATRLGLIFPMFRALGWDIENVNEVNPEENVYSLDRKIAFVDEEIDRKVYELYGLTEDEVKIVEGG